MLSRRQQILLKRAQAQAGIDDTEYRQAIEMISGLPKCNSSKDPRLTDRTLDNLLAYFETIYWRRVDLAELAHNPDPKAVFQHRGYWTSKNPKQNTSRDRYTTADLDRQITAAENDLLQNHNCNLRYLQGIQVRIQPFDKRNYLAALKRTLAAKQRAACNPNSGQLHL